MDFEATYRQYGDMLYRIAFVYTGSPYTAEDILQEVFIALMNTKKNFKSEEHKKAWLIRVTHNKCINTLKAQSNKAICIDELNLKVTDSNSEQKIDVIKQVFALPVKYKAVIILYYYNDYSVDEIAKILKISKSAVKMRLSRGRELLKLHLEDYSNE